MCDTTSTRDTHSKNKPKRWYIRQKWPGTHRQQEAHANHKQDAWVGGIFRGTDKQGAYDSKLMLRNTSLVVEILVRKTSALFTRLTKLQWNLLPSPDSTKLHQTWPLITRLCQEPSCPTKNRQALLGFAWPRSRSPSSHTASLERIVAKKVSGASGMQKNSWNICLTHHVLTLTVTTSHCWAKGSHKIPQ